MIQPDNDIVEKNLFADKNLRLSSTVESVNPLLAGCLSLLEIGIASYTFRSFLAGVTLQLVGIAESKTKWRKEECLTVGR